MRLERISFTPSIVNEWISRLAEGSPVSSLFAHQPRPLALPAALLFALAFVVQFLAAGDRNLDLGATLRIEIELQRHERHALALHRASELVDFTSVQQQLAGPPREMIETVRLQIFGDIGVVEPQFAGLLRRIGFGDRRLALPQRLDLGPGQRDAGLVGVADRSE